MSDKLGNAELAVGRMDASGWNYEIGWLRVIGQHLICSPYISGDCEMVLLVWLLFCLNVSLGRASSSM